MARGEALRLAGRGGGLLAEGHPSSSAARSPWPPCALGWRPFPQDFVKTGQGDPTFPALGWPSVPRDGLTAWAWREQPRGPPPYRVEVTPSSPFASCRKGQS